jgi:hypothetical protein
MVMVVLMVMVMLMVMMVMMGFMVMMTIVMIVMRGQKTLLQHVWQDAEIGVVAVELELNFCVLGRPHERYFQAWDKFDNRYDRGRNRDTVMKLERDK